MRGYTHADTLMDARGTPRPSQCFNLDDGTSFLRADFSIDCDKSMHKFMEGYAWVMMVIIPLGVPLLYVRLFQAYDHELRQLQSNDLLCERLEQARAPTL
jgi:hypothetical protein